MADERPPIEQRLSRYATVAQALEYGMRHEPEDSSLLLLYLAAHEATKDTMVGILEPYAHAVLDDLAGDEHDIDPEMASSLVKKFGKDLSGASDIIDESYEEIMGEEEELETVIVFGEPRRLSSLAADILDFVDTRGEVDIYTVWDEIFQRQGGLSDDDKEAFSRAKRELFALNTRGRDSVFGTRGERRNTTFFVAEGAGLIFPEREDAPPEG